MACAPSARRLAATTPDRAVADAKRLCPADDRNHYLVFRPDRGASRARVQAAMDAAGRHFTDGDALMSPYPSDGGGNAPVAMGERG